MTFVQIVLKTRTTFFIGSVVFILVCKLFLNSFCTLKSRYEARYVYYKEELKKEKKTKPQKFSNCRLKISLSLASEIVLAAITLTRDFPILAANMRFLV